MMSSLSTNSADHNVDLDARDDAPDGDAIERLTRVPTFSARQFRDQFERDVTVRVGLIVLIALSVVGSVLSEPIAGIASVMTLALLVLWLWVGLRSAYVSQQIPRLTMLLDENPEVMEAELAPHLRRPILQERARVMLYHRLAALRYRQRRFDEASAICWSLLSRSAGGTADTRSSLLLLLADCRRRVGDLAGTWGALRSLYRLKLDLSETLFLVLIQLRYEHTCGYHDRVLHELSEKLAMLDLMPPEIAGPLHRLVAMSAEGLGRSELADWLRERAELLHPEAITDAEEPLLPIPMPAATPISPADLGSPD